MAAGGRPTPGGREDRGRHRRLVPDRLAYYKAPATVAFVDAVPLTSTQKIQRGGLKDLVAAMVGMAFCIDTRGMKKRMA